MALITEEGNTGGGRSSTHLEIRIFNLAEWLELEIKNVFVCIMSIESYGAG